MTEVRAHPLPGPEFSSSHADAMHATGCQPSPARGLYRLRTRGGSGELSRQTIMLLTLSTQTIPVDTEVISPGAGTAQLATRDPRRIGTANYSKLLLCCRERPLHENDGGLSPLVHPPVSWCTQ